MHMYYITYLRFYSLGMVVQILRFVRFVKNAERILLLKFSRLGVQMLLLDEQSAKHCLALEWLRTGFGLATGFIILFYIQSVATLRNTLLHTHARTIVSTVMSSLPLLGSGFQAPTADFPFFWVPKLSPYLSYSNSNSFVAIHTLHMTEAHVTLAQDSKLTKLTETKSKSCYDWWSISQYVLASSPLWNLWPDIIFCLKVAVLCLWGALSAERSGLSLVSHCQQYLVHCQNLIYFTFYMSHMFYVYAVYTRPLSAQAQYSRSCPIICSLRYAWPPPSLSLFYFLYWSSPCPILPTWSWSLKLKLIYDRQSDGQSVLVSGAHLGPVTSFSFAMKFPVDSWGFVIL
jgi:hypothetical protein